MWDVESGDREGGARVARVQGTSVGRWTAPRGGGSSNVPPSRAECCCMGGSDLVGSFTDRVGSIDARMVPFSTYRRGFAPRSRR